MMELRFDGASYEAEQDRERLGRQLASVKAYMLMHEWVTLAELEDHVHGTAASLSARLRDLRKSRNGGYTVERKRITGGVYAYRIARD